MKQITISANNLFQAGEKLGFKEQQSIWKFYKFNESYTRKKYGIKFEKFSARLKPLKKQIIKSTPAAWEYLQGLARGSRLNLNFIIAMNSYDLLDNGCFGTSIGRQKCTTASYHSKTNSWLAYNDEWDPAFLPYLNLITYKLPRLSFTSLLMFPGELGGYGTGFNSHGLIYANNTLTLKTDGFGLPLLAALFEINQSKTSDEFLKRLEKIKTGSSVNLNFLEKNLITLVEHRRDGKNYIVQKKSGYLVHANHALPSSCFFGEEKFPNLRSQARWQRAQQIIEKEKIIDGKKALEKILFDTRGKYVINNTDVMASCAYDLGTKTLTIKPRGSSLQTVAIY